jgi:DNA-directed RNA polymerase specialized sigma24 family protein
MTQTIDTADLRGSTEAAALAEQWHQLEDPALDAAFARLAPGHPERAEQQFTRLYEAEAGRVLRIIAAALRVEDRQEAEDLAQDVWLWVWARIQRGDVLRNPAALVALMARHRAVDYYRRAHTRYENATDYAEPASVLLLPATASAEAEALDATDTRAAALAG